MAEEYLVPPKQPPPLNVPKSDTIVKVSCIDCQLSGSTSRFKLPLSPFLQPDYVGHPDLLGPSFSFLIEHPTKKPVLYDLGVRTDFDKLPSYSTWVNLKWDIHVEKDVATILKENGVDVDGGAIGAIIWSHQHWDHVGDASTFPGSTELVVGPGFKQAYMPGFPVRQDSTLLDTDFQGRNVREVDFEGGATHSRLKIGRFNALDYFGDGSFYLLDTPGHTIGHICGFARTSINPDTFIFMGGDAGHHGGQFRPTQYLPIPKELQPSPFKRRAPVCPGHVLQDINPHVAADKPFYYVTEAFAHDKTLVDWTVDGLGEFDAHTNVLLLLAHDDAIVDPAQIDFYPKSLNDWYAQGVGKKVKWMFFGDFEEAVEAKEAGRKAFAWA